MTTFAQVRQQLIGNHAAVPTPFGNKPLVYADATASGRAVSSIEQYIEEQVLPYYANTHSESSFTGRYTSALREQSRQLIADSVNADDRYAVIFSGAGATAAITKWVGLLNIEPCSDTVVVLGPYEHHSNELVWRELGVPVVNASLASDGSLCLASVQSLLEQYRGQRIIGSFSAASNVTGIRTPLSQLAQLFQQHDAILGIDFAAAAPYIDIDVAGLDIDAAFISTHKFVGGPSTPGLLIVKRDLVNVEQAPTVCGGGTVRYVDQNNHWYTESIERREEAGTPAIVDSIRAGLAFKLKSDLGEQAIEQREQQLAEQAFAFFRDKPQFELLGGDKAARLPIFSFRLMAQGVELHYGFVVALLNDLFGIQVRGGCSCAGPYAHHLLNLSKQQAAIYEHKTGHGQAGYRPGWVRFNLHFLMSQNEVQYIFDALSYIAEHAINWVAHYQFNERSGVWQYTGSQSLSVTLGQSLEWGHAESFNTAVDGAYKLAESLSQNQRVDSWVDQERWFVLPEDVVTNQCAG